MLILLDFLDRNSNRSAQFGLEIYNIRFNIQIELNIETILYSSGTITIKKVKSIRLPKLEYSDRFVEISLFFSRYFFKYTGYRIGKFKDIRYIQCMGKIAICIFFLKIYNYYQCEFRILTFRQCILKCSTARPHQMNIIMWVIKIVLIAKSNISFKFTYIRDAYIFSNALFSV